MLMQDSEALKVRTLAELLQGHAVLPQGVDAHFRDMHTDSRKVSAGDLFVAVPGVAGDGRHYVREAVNAGAAAVLVEADDEWSQLTRQGDVPVIPVPRLGSLVGVLAGRHLGDPSRVMDVVAVTGTNGKTSCVTFLTMGFTLLGRRAAMVGTIGCGFPGRYEEATHTTPDALNLQRMLGRLREQGAEAIALEASSHGLEQGRLNGVRIRTGVFTNLSRDHLDYHRSMDEYGAAKLRLFHHPELESAVINRDDPFGRWIVEQLPRNLGLLTFSSESAHADVHVERVERSAHGFDLVVGTPWGRLQFQTPLLGDFNISNLLAAITVFGLRGFSLADIEHAAASLETVPGRMELVSGTSKPAVVVDYAHTPDALENVLTALRAHCGGQLWCVFGCGGNRDAGKRPQMGEIAARCADRIIVTDDNPRRENPQGIIDEIVAGMPAGVAYEVERNRADAIRNAITRAAPDDIVVIAGKGHETYQDIDGRRWPFSDTEQARSAIAARGAGS